MTKAHLFAAFLLAAVASVAAAWTDDTSSREAAAVVIETLPASRGGQDLVGKRLEFPLSFDRWVDREDQHRSPRPKRGQLTLYRWWTDSCPFCTASLPAVEKLRRAGASRGLAVVGVYHPKPPRAVTDEVIVAAAAARGYTGAIAVDDDWSVLRSIAPGAARTLPTSMSFLVDGNGVIRFVHPGPVLFPSDDRRHARENSDYRLLERAIDRLLDATRSSEQR